MLRDRHRSYNDRPMHFFHDGTQLKQTNTNIGSMLDQYNVNTVEKPLDVSCTMLEDRTYPRKAYRPSGKQSTCSLRLTTAVLLEKRTILLKLIKLL